MDIYAVLGELLYIISNYEKGRIKSRGLWNIKYMNSLNESLSCMSIILKIIEKPNEDHSAKLFYIKEFCKKNEFVIFPTGDLHLLDHIAKTSHEEDLDDEDVNIVYIMKRIIDECIILLQTKSKGYKLRLATLLKSFHNLPRVFLNRSPKKIYNINTKPITTRDALLYASSYIDLNPYK